MGNDEPDMASLTSPRRPDTTDRQRLVLEASEAVREDDLADVDPVSWPVAAVVGGLATAAVGWVLASGLVVCGWLMGDEAGLSAALELGTRLWLLGSGVPVDVGGLDVHARALGPHRRDRRDALALRGLRGPPRDARQPRRAVRGGARA